MSSARVIERLRRMTWPYLFTKGIAEPVDTAQRRGVARGVLLVFFMVECRVPGVADLDRSHRRRSSARTDGYALRAEWSTQPTQTRPTNTMGTPSRRIHTRLRLMA